MAGSSRRQSRELVDYLGHSVETQESLCHSNSILDFPLRSLKIKLENVKLIHKQIKFLTTQTFTLFKQRQ